MTKHLLKEYLHAFRWKNIKDNYHNGNLWFYIYFLLIMPVCLLPNIVDIRSGIIFYGWSIPVAFLFFSVDLHPLTMSKLSYLCPMNRDERLYYLKQRRWIRILFPCVIEMIVIIAMLFTGICNRGVLLYVLLLFITLALSLSLCDTILRKTSAATTPRRHWESINMLLLLFEMFILIEQILSTDSIKRWEIIAAFLIYFFLNLPIMLRILRDQQQVLETYLLYENTLCVVTERHASAERLKGGVG
jgi:hypothetical protein